MSIQLSGGTPVLVFCIRLYRNSYIRGFVFVRFSKQYPKYLELIDIFSLNIPDVPVGRVLGNIILPQMERRRGRDRERSEVLDTMENRYRYWYTFLLLISQLSRFVHSLGITVSRKFSH
jgi:hypothetical protein